MSESNGTKSVLFVCMGNICRSPTGEGVMRQVVADRDLDGQVHIDSAGTIGYHVGQPADGRMRAAASKRGYRLDSRARQFVPNDFERFDLIIAMDRDNERDILNQDVDGAFAGKVKLLGAFLDDSDAPDVPDPYYGGDAGFEHVLDMIEQACPRILDQLITQ